MAERATPPRRRPLSPRTKALILGVALLALGNSLLFVAALLPTRLDPLRAEYAPFVQRGERDRVGAGCGLTEVAVAGACEPARPESIDEVEVTFESRLDQKFLPALRGTLSIPRGLDGPRPGVVLLAGSGAVDRDSASFGDILRRNRAAPFPILQELASLLAQQGLVVLRYDKRSCVRCYEEAHDPWPDFRQFRVQDLEMDARDAVMALKARPEVDPHAIVVIGHSQGGKLAPHVAAGDRDVAAVVMLAGTTQSMKDGVLEQLARIGRIRRRQGDLAGALALAIQRRPFAECLDRLEGVYDPDDMCFGGGLTLAALAEEHAQAAATIEQIRGLHCPLLVLAGALDRNVDPSVARGIAEATRGRDVEVHLLADLDHLLNDITDLKQPPEFGPGVEPALSAFLRGVRRPD